MQVLLHVGRERGGKRRLTDISVLRRTDTGLVQAAPVWQVDRGLSEHVAEFRALLRERTPA